MDFSIWDFVSDFTICDSASGFSGLIAAGRIGFCGNFFKSSSRKKKIIKKIFAKLTFEQFLILVFYSAKAFLILITGLTTDFRDDCAEFILYVSLHFWFSASVNCFFFAKSLNMLIKKVYSRQKPQVYLGIVIFYKFQVVFLISFSSFFSVCKMYIRRKLTTLLQRAGGGCNYNF